MITVDERFIGSKVQRFFNWPYDVQTFIGKFGEPKNPKNPKNLQNLFLLAKSYQVPLFLNLTTLPRRGRPYASVKMRQTLTLKPQTYFISFGESEQPENLV